jgi:hypothetical protein
MIRCRNTPIPRILADISPLPTGNLAERVSRRDRSRHHNFWALRYHDIANSLIENKQRSRGRRPSPPSDGRCPSKNSPEPIAFSNGRRRLSVAIAPRARGFLKRRGTHRRCGKSACTETEADMARKRLAESDVTEEAARILFLTYGDDAVHMAVLRCAELNKVGDRAGVASWKKIHKHVRKLAAANPMHSGTIN